MPRSRLIGPAALVLIAAAALAGCKSQGSERALARFHGGDAVRAQTLQATPDGGQDAGMAAEAVDGPAAPQTAARFDPTGSRPEVDARPERFRGLDRSALDAQLGRPALVRTEGPARVWQYRGRACVLDLVLYPGPEGPTVRHLEARDPVDAAPHDTAACLRGLLQRRVTAATG